MINPGHHVRPVTGNGELPVFSLSYRSLWCGVRATAFLSQEDAEASWIKAVTGDAEQRAELRRLRVTAENALVERTQERRDPIEDYCIVSHQLEVGVSGARLGPSVIPSTRGFPWANALAESRSPDIPRDGGSWKRLP